MKLVISPKAEKQLKKLSKIDQIAIGKRIRLLTADEQSNFDKLSGYKNIYRVRLGNMRIVFKKSKNLVYIILIHHRKDVYKLLKRLFD